MNDPAIKKGSFIGGTLLVAGCCIGAGMLGLPVLSGQAGFLPSIAVFFLCWLFMLTTGLLLLEVNLFFGKGASIITMAGKTLGTPGKIVSWMVYLFLFYSLMVAYVSASGSLIADVAGQLTGSNWHHGFGGFLFCLIFGVMLYLGTGAMDWFNRLLMAGLLISYVSLIIVGAPFVNSNFLKESHWTGATLVIPAAIISFGLHNLIPSLTIYFQASVKPLKWALILGSAIPLLVYILWEWLILGIVPLADFKTALDNGEIATEALKTAVGASWVLDVAQAFAFFAIVTSFLSVSLSFVDFLADGLKIKKSAKGKVILSLLVLAPPYLFSLAYPAIFLTALNTAGGFGAVILFGILPALMVWKGRYGHLGQIDGLLAGSEASHGATFEQKQPVRLVPGGKPLLILIIAFALWVMALQLI